MQCQKEGDKREREGGGIKILRQSTKQSPKNGSARTRTMQCTWGMQREWGNLLFKSLQVFLPHLIFFESCTRRPDFTHTGRSPPLPFSDHPPTPNPPWDTEERGHRRLSFEREQKSQTHSFRPPVLRQSMLACAGMD